MRPDADVAQRTARRRDSSHEIIEADGTIAGKSPRLRILGDHAQSGGSFDADSQTIGDLTPDLSRERLCQRTGTPRCARPAVKMTKRQYPCFRWGLRAQFWRYLGRVSLHFGP
jgi:hypothetical protein